MRRSATLNRLLSLVLALAMLASLATPAMAAEDGGISFKEVDSSSVTAQITNRETAEFTEEKAPYADHEVVRVSIFLEKPATIEAGYEANGIAGNRAALSYRAGLKANQKVLAKEIEKATGEKLDVVWNLTLTANVISANVKYGQIKQIEKVKGVTKVVLETLYTPDVVSTETAGPNMATSGKQIGSTAAWAAGYTGAGSKIAIIDTGLDVQHEAFSAAAFEYSMRHQSGDYDLMSADDIEAVFGELHAAAFANGNAANLYVNSKVPFGVNYIDENLDLSHYNSEHGSHVAGIAAANAYVETDRGFVPSLTSTFVQGVAPNAQLLVMKVFGTNGGAYDSDYMAAIEDAIVLGADSVNLSLGSSAPGMTHNATYQELLDGLTESGVVVVMSTGNNSYWAEKSTYGYLYLDDTGFHTGGAPGTYTNSLGVASVNNDGTMGYSFTVGGQTVVYEDASGDNNQPLASLSGDHEYVFIDGLGTPEDWDAVGNALAGKIAVCSRGETSFAEKAQAAVDAGAAALIIYNNQAGVIYAALDGYTGTAPVVTVTQKDGELLKANATAAQSGNYYVGTLTVNSTYGPAQYNSEYYTMSSFSSWGVPGTLEMKPEITAPGGNIYSVAGDVPGYISGHNQYESMDGTSMAAPQVAGMVAVLTQYFRESGLVQKTGKDARVLAQSLLMSTAEPIVNGENGYYYPVIQQGAGLANVGNAVAADSYILMNKDATASYADGKVKVELGDDPDRTGKYTFSFTVNNLTDKALTYELAADVFTQDAFSSSGVLFMDTWTTPLDPALIWKVDGEYVDMEGVAEEMDFNGDGTVNAADGQALLDYTTGLVTSLTNADKADLDGDGKITTYDAYLFFTMAENGPITVPASDSITVELTITLSEGDKQWLDGYYTNGAYIEAYVYAKSVPDDEGVKGTCHSIPVLGFYGSWSEASMFDKGSYMEYAYGEENRLPYLYNINGFAGNSFYLAYSDTPGSVYYFGGNPVKQDATYMPERNAISGANADTLYGMSFTAIRSAADSLFFIRNAETGAYLVADQYGPVTGAFYYPNGGAWQATKHNLTLGMNFAGVPDNTPLEVGMTLIPEYYVAADGSIDLSRLDEGATFSIPMVVDNTAPVMDKLALSTDKKTLTITASDNQYVAGVALLNEQGTYMWTYTGAHATAAPGDTLEYTLDVSEVAGTAFLIQVIDYAFNVRTYLFKQALGDLTDEVEGVTVSATSLALNKGENKKLTAVVAPANVSNGNVTWSSTNEAVATVDANGVVTAVSEGTANIVAASELDPTKTATCAVTVFDIRIDMNGLVWDEEGSIWYSKFNTGTLPAYEKLSGDLLESGYFVSAAVGPDGTIYAGTEDGDYTGALYTIDPDTFETTKLMDANAGIDLFYADLTYAPEMLGEGYLLGVYGKYVVMIDPVTGECLGAIDQFDEVLVGIASCSGEYDGENSANTVYLVTSSGKLIQEIYCYIGSEDILFPYCKELLGGRVAMNTGINKGSAEYFNSLHYDGQYVFWSAFEQGVDDQVTLYAIDEQADFAVCQLGRFGKDVWPVAGLHQPSATGTQGSMETLEQIKAAIAEKGMPEVQEIQIAKLEKPVKEAAGGLNAVPGDQAPALPMADEDDVVTVEVTAKNASGVEVDSTNGLITVTYDADALELKSIVVNGDYTSVNKQAGVVTFAYVAEEGIAAGEAVATLSFVNKGLNSEKITITHKQENQNSFSYEEKADIAAPAGLVEWVSASTTLGGNIGLNFYVKLSQDLVNDPSTFVRFTFAGKTVDVPMSEAVVSVKNGETRYRFTCQVTSKNMADLVTAQVMTSAGAVGAPTAMDVATYCTYMINNSADAELVTLMKAMLNYGASAQLLFGYNTDDLANAGLSAQDKVLADVDASGYACVITGSEDGLELSSATLLLDSETSIRVYFTLTGSKTVDQYTFYVNGQEVTPVAKGDKYYIELKDIPAQQLDLMHTFKLGGVTVKFSGLSYVDLVMNNPSASAETVNMAKALYAYSMAAEAYAN